MKKRILIKLGKAFARVGAVFTGIGFKLLGKANPVSPPQEVVIPDDVATSMSQMMDQLFSQLMGGQAA